MKPSSTSQRRISAPRESLSSIPVAVSTKTEPVKQIDNRRSSLDHNLVTSTTEPSTKPRRQNWNKTRQNVSRPPQQVKRALDDKDAEQNVTPSKRPPKTTTIKTMKQISSQNQPATPVLVDDCKSASRIKEMLESVRNRVAAAKASGLSEAIGQLQKETTPVVSKTGTKRVSLATIMDVIDFDDLENILCYDCLDQLLTCGLKNKQKAESAKQRAIKKEHLSRSATATKPSTLQRSNTYNSKVPNQTRTRFSLGNTNENLKAHCQRFY